MNASHYLAIAVAALAAQQGDTSACIALDVGSRHDLVITESVRADVTIQLFGKNVSLPIISTVNWTASLRAGSLIEESGAQAFELVLRSFEGLVEYSHPAFGEARLEFSSEQPQKLAAPPELLSEIEATMKRLVGTYRLTVDASGSISEFSAGDGELATDKQELATDRYDLARLIDETDVRYLAQFLFPRDSDNPVYHLSFRGQSMRFHPHVELDAPVPDEGRRIRYEVSSPINGARTGWESDGPAEVESATMFGEYLASMEDRFLHSASFVFTLHFSHGDPNRLEFSYRVKHSVEIQRTTEH